MLVLSRSQYDALVDHAREGAPEEVCGMLSGSRSDDVATVERVDRVANVADASRVTYTLDPEEQLSVMDDVEAAGDEVVGFYHSHPAGPPRPSETDAAQAAWPGYTYVIVSLDGAEPFVGAWRWDGTEFQREDVRVR